MKFYVSIILLLILGFSASGQTVADGFSVMPSGQREVLRKWLKSNSFYRLATEESDCSNKEGLKATRDYWGSLYYPYYKSGEFNNDGNDDFAVVLIDKRKRKSNFDVAIFHGDARGSHSAKPFYISKGFDLASGGLFYHGYGRRGGRLSAGSFESDDGTIFVFARNRYVEKGFDTP